MSDELRVAVPLDEVEGLQEGNRYRVREGDTWYEVRLIRQAGEWYFISEDGGRSWPLISLRPRCALSTGRYAAGTVEGVACGEVSVVAIGRPGAWEVVEASRLAGRSVLVDVRLVARSRWWPQWNRRRLLAQWGSRYTHEREAVAPGSMVEGAVDLLLKGLDVVVLCGCAGDEQGCRCQQARRLIEEQVAVAWKRLSLGERVARRLGA